MFLAETQQQLKTLYNIKAAVAVTEDCAKEALAVLNYQTLTSSL